MTSQKIYNLIKRGRQLVSMVVSALVDKQIPQPFSSLFRGIYQKTAQIMRGSMAESTVFLSGGWSHLVGCSLHGRAVLELINLQMKLT